jgi:hypothetical protein
MSMTSEGDMISIRQPASFASARTTNVLPVPWGPEEKTSRHTVFLQNTLLERRWVK